MLINYHLKTITKLIVLLLCGSSTQAIAALANNAVLNFNDGVTEVSCEGGIGVAPDNCTYGVVETVNVGSYWGVDSQGDGVVNDFERLAIINAGVGLVLDTPQAAGEIDETWFLDGLPGNHKSTDIDGLNIILATVNTAVIDMTGWELTWNGGVYLGSDMNNANNPYASIICGIDCSEGDAFILNYDVIIPCGAFDCPYYALHLEGTISAVPVPAAAWLFFSGLIALIGFGRRQS